MTEELLKKLERFQNLAILFIFGLRKYDHISQFRAQLNWLPIRLRRDMHIITFLFKILNYQRGAAARSVTVTPTGCGFDPHSRR